MSDPGPILSTRRIRSPEEEARYWRGRAAEVRKVQTLFSDPVSRARLAEIAAHYDEIASDLEGEEKDRVPGAGA